TFSRAVSWDIFRRASMSTIVSVRSAQRRDAADRSAGWCKPVVRPSIARVVSDDKSRVPVREEELTAYANIKTETKGRVGIIRLDRPKALNALCADLVSELGQALDAFEADRGIGCMVLTGSDKAFAAGADIKEMKEKSYQDVFLEDFITVGWEKVSQVRKPIVAAVAGDALGGGCGRDVVGDLMFYG